MSLSLLGWRREVARLYADVRAAADPAAGWESWRAGRDRLFAEHPDSPLDPSARAAFTGLTFPAYDPALRFVTELDSDVERIRIEVPTAGDGIVPFVRIGRVALGQLGGLDVWWLDSYGGGIFVPLRDGSSGAPQGSARSYGGGRYVLDTVKGADLGSADAQLVVDLNFSYHPSCAYNPEWTCPLAPDGNRLTATVAVGEQLPPGGWY
ncbi:MAG: DUF1684 domain-containing protein [Geodermatophilaceae bacterium]|nr:DUF1684 domain-containing protein [Geodermatophilaceae bacterium]